MAEEMPQTKKSTKRKNSNNDVLPSKQCNSKLKKNDEHIAENQQKQKTFRLNPAPNLINRAKTDLTRTQQQSTKIKTAENIEKNNKNEMDTSPIPSNNDDNSFITNNRFALLQTSESYNLNATNEENSIIEIMKKQNEQNRKTDNGKHRKNRESPNDSGTATVALNPTETRPARIPSNKEGPTIKRRDRPPPINIIRQEPKNTATLIESQLKIKEFQIKRIHNGKHILYMKNIEDYHKAVQILKKVKTIFHTFTPKTEKPQTLLIKGLSNAFNSAEILEELQEKNIPNVHFTKVQKFKTKNSTAKNISLPIFLTQMTPESDIQNVFKIKQVHHQIIRWEKLKKKEPIQCYRCQAIGHTSHNCYREYRCVKCSENHEPGECKIKKSATVEKEKIYCVNCKEYGHPASYRGCPKLLLLKEKINKKVADNKEQASKKIANIANRVTPNISYASKVKNMANISTSENKETNTNSINSTNPNNDNDASGLLNSLIKTMNELKSIITLIDKRSKENEEKLDSLFDLLHYD